MATQQLDFVGYFFGVETEGKLTEYPNYDLAVDGLRFRRLDGRKHTLKFWARYQTPPLDASDPGNAPDE